MSLKELAQSLIPSTSKSADKWVRRRTGQQSMPPVYEEDETRSIRRTQRLSRRQLLSVTGAACFVGYISSADKTVAKTINNVVQDGPIEPNKLISPSPWIRR